VGPQPIQESKSEEKKPIKNPGAKPIENVLALGEKKDKVIDKENRVKGKRRGPGNGWGNHRGERTVSCGADRRGGYRTN